MMEEDEGREDADQTEGGNQNEEDDNDQEDDVPDEMTFTLTEDEINEQPGPSTVEEKASDPPTSPLLVPNEKDKQPADGEKNKERSNAVSVNSDMILEALESLERKNLRGTSLEQILDFLIRSYPVSRDRKSLKAELSGCLDAAVGQGLVRLNQNGSYRLASFHEEAANREHGHESGGQDPLRGKKRTPSKPARPARPTVEKPRRRQRRRSPPRAVASDNDSDDPDWRPSSALPSVGSGRGRRRSKQATRKSPRLNASTPGRQAPKTKRAAARAATPAKPTATPARGRASTPAPVKRPTKRKASVSSSRTPSRSSRTPRMASGSAGRRANKSAKRRRL